MQDEAGKLDAGVLLEAQQRVDDVVQAVGLAGGAGASADHLVHVGVVQAHRVDVGLGLRVVGVGANENLVVLVVDGRGCQACHFTDHAHFVPGRDHDGQGLFRYFEQAFFVGFFVLVVDAKAPDQLAAPVAKVDEQVIQAQQEHQRGQDDREYLQAEQHIGEKIDECQAHVPVTGRKGWAIVYILVRFPGRSCTTCRRLYWIDTSSRTQGCPNFRLFLVGHFL
ncbi:hypothetical protein D3C75_641280 [compost metagenome]